MMNLEIRRGVVGIYIVVVVLITGFVGGFALGRGLFFASNIQNEISPENRDVILAKGNLEYIGVYTQKSSDSEEVLPTQYRIIEGEPYQFETQLEAQPCRIKAQRILQIGSDEANWKTIYTGTSPTDVKRCVDISTPGSEDVMLVGRNHVAYQVFGWEWWEYILQNILSGEDAFEELKLRGNSPEHLYGTGDDNSFIMVSNFDFFTGLGWPAVIVGDSTELNLSFRIVYEGSKNGGFPESIRHESFSFYDGKFRFWTQDEFEKEIYYYEYDPHENVLIKRI